MYRTRPRVLCTVNLTLAPDALVPLRKVAEVDQLPIDRELILERIGEYDAYYGHVCIRIDREFIDRAKRLKVVAAPSTGTDHIDVKLLKERGITLLALTCEYDLLDTFTATAECAWGLLIACTRRIPTSVETVRRGLWPREAFFGENFESLGRQLSGKTLGVLGVGRLGKMVVEYGKAFRMRVLGCDPKSFAIEGVERVDFDTLLRESDVISIHVHLNDETRGLISRAAFDGMKDGVVLINTSRGALIDEEAFLENLESGKVAAAGLDVIDGEWMENVGRHPLVQYAQKHDNLLITSHIGGATYESIVDARVFLAKRLAEYIEQSLGNIENGT